MSADLTPKTILMTADTVGGVWIYALELARALGEAGICVVLAAMGEPLSDDQRTAADRLKTVTVEAMPCKLEWMQDPWSDVERSGTWLLDLERRYRPSVIHLNGYAHGSLPWSAPVLVVGHSCVWSWFVAVRGELPPASWAVYRERVRAGLKAADAVVAPTQTMLDALRTHYGAFRAAGVVYNARRGDIYRPADRQPFILTAGRLWDEAKNVRALEAVGHEIDWPIYAAGSTRNPDGGEVRFHHLQALGLLSEEELADWMGRAAVYALPALYEPFGLTALEAARSGCALVLGDIPTLRELWEGAAVFVKPYDHGTLAAVFRTLSEDESRRSDLAARARVRAGEFTVGRMSAAYRGIYARLISGVRARPVEARTLAGKGAQILKQNKGLNA